MDDLIRQWLKIAQENEITEYHVYMALARLQKDPNNRAVLEQIAEDEHRHARFWEEMTKVKAAPRRTAVWGYTLAARLFGLTFAVKLMERGEQRAQQAYGKLVGSVQEAGAIAEDEGDHERKLLAMLDEERLKYVGSVVLGLSDALVELTGALAGLTLALADSRLIAMVGLITGIAASLSMAASEYLSTKAEEDSGKTPLKASMYTGITYLSTVILLIVPFMVLPHALVALAATLTAAILIILGFTYYVAVAKDLPLWSRFGEMAGLTLAVAGASFLIGFIVRLVFGVEA